MSKDEGKARQVSNSVPPDLGLIGRDFAKFRLPAQRLSQIAPDHRFLEHAQLRRKTCPENRSFDGTCLTSNAELSRIVEHE